MPMFPAIIHQVKIGVHKKESPHTWFSWGGKPPDAGAGRELYLLKTTDCNN